jgi:hypothetical protein
MRHFHALAILTTLFASTSAFATPAPTIRPALKASFTVYTTEGPVFPLTHSHQFIPSAIRQGHTVLAVTHAMLDAFIVAGGIQDYQLSANGYLNSVSIQEKDGTTKAFAASDPHAPIDVTTDQNKITYRYYGWCYAINHHLITETPASQMKVLRHDQVTWYYGHLDSVNGTFQKGCVPEYAPLSALLK